MDALTVSPPVSSSSAVVDPFEKTAPGNDVTEPPPLSVVADMPPAIVESAYPIALARLLLPEPIVTGPLEPGIVIVAIAFSVTRQPSASAPWSKQLLSGSERITQSFSLQIRRYSTQERSACANAAWSYFELDNTDCTSAGA